MVCSSCCVDRMKLVFFHVNANPQRSHQTILQMQNKSSRNWLTEWRCWHREATSEFYANKPSQTFTAAHNIISRWSFSIPSTGDAFWRALHLFSRSFQKHAAVESLLCFVTFQDPSFPTNFPSQKTELFVSHFLDFYVTCWFSKVSFAWVYINKCSSSSKSIQKSIMERMVLHVYICFKGVLDCKID